MTKFIISAVLLVSGLPAGAQDFTDITPKMIDSLAAGLPVARAYPAQEEEKKFTVCWIKGVRENTCVYKCNDGKTLEQPMTQAQPGQPPAPLCAQLLFPHNKAADSNRASQEKTFSMLFFDEYGDGERLIPAALARYGVEVVSAEQEGRMTFVTYKADRQLIEQAETKVYGAAGAQALTAELDGILGRLKAEGKRVVWLSRWTELPQIAATVYYLDAPGAR